MASLLQVIFIIKRLAVAEGPFLHLVTLRWTKWTEIGLKSLFRDLAEAMV